MLDLLVKASQKRYYTHMHNIYVYREERRKMKTDRVKQVICIAANNPMEFQDRMNESLRFLSDPEITFFKDMPYYAVISYVVKRDMPENVLELFEMVEGKHYTCEACPHFGKSDDKRKKWGYCTLSSEPTRIDSRACERFYVYRYRVLAEAKEEYLQIPYTTK